MSLTKLFPFKPVPEPDSAAMLHQDQQMFIKPLASDQRWGCSRGHILSVIGSGDSLSINYETVWWERKITVSFRALHLLFHLDINHRNEVSV